MTTRDPRSRDRGVPDSGSAREPTQSLSLDADEVDPHPSLALGTHEAAADQFAEREERTKVESPSARTKPVVAQPPPVPKNAGIDERLGQVLGSYKILEVLGRGGMGQVYRAEHTKLGREVALKLLRSDYAKRRDAVARFFQEARTVNRVRHRNIVDVTDFVELADGTTFIIMELLSGQSLGRWARSGVDLPRALAVLVQICDGLGAAHQVGVIHRDLKPDNVIVVPTSDGAELVKLLDFGVAKLLNRDDEDFGFQTAAGSVIGTPAYMSPEQAGGMVVDARSDIYSLGAIMYELFCGAPMFRGRSFGEYVRKHLTEMPVPPSQTEGGRTIDPRLEAVIMHCLAKTADERFASILELRDALLGILGGIETHPPSYGTVSNLPRPHTGLAPSVAAVMQTMVPHQAATVFPHPSGPQQLHPSLVFGPPPSYGVPAHHTPPPATHVVNPPTPWWVWAVGGTIAVSLGVAAAVWYAGQGAELPAAPQLAAAPTPQPEVEPIEAPPPSKVAVHFEANPAAELYADGSSMLICKTPCDHTIDLKDGGATDRRNFVVKATGHRDARIEVDLAPQGKRTYVAQLDKLPTIVEPTPVPTVVTEPEPEPEPETPTRITRKKKSSTRVESRASTPEDTEDDEPPPPTPKKKPPVDKKIDQTQTLDPFKR